jgi:hypothetical protein
LIQLKQHKKGHKQKNASRTKNPKNKKKTEKNTESQRYAQRYTSASGRSARRPPAARCSSGAGTRLRWPRAPRSWPQSRPERTRRATAAAGLPDGQMQREREKTRRQKSGGWDSVFRIVIKKISLKNSTRRCCDLKFGYNEDIALPFGALTVPAASRRRSGRSARYRPALRPAPQR